MFSNNFKNENEIAEAAIRIIVFFDLFDYPLTVFEIWKWLDGKVALFDLEKILDSELVLKFVSKKDGFLFLPGRIDLLSTRRERHNHSLRKIKIARRFVELFKICPFVQSVLLVNSIGQNNMRDSGDIDFLIITAPRRLWLTRLFCTGIAKLSNSRPTKENKKDKICLSFYLSAEDMNLKEFEIADGDPYFFYWLRSLVLLYNKNGTFENFLADNNLFSHYSGKTSLTPFLKSNKVWDYLEKAALNFQLAIMSPVLKKAINNSDGVVINDKAIKLYLSDKRQEYAKEYGNRLKKIFTENN